MYNTSKFNLQPFNITSVDIDDVSDTAHIAAAVYSAVYRGGNSYDEIDISAAASVSVTPAAGLRRRITTLRCALMQLKAIPPSLVFRAR